VPDASDVVALDVTAHAVFGVGNRGSQEHQASHACAGRGGARAEVCQKERSIARMSEVRPWTITVKRPRLRILLLPYQFTVRSSATQNA
jgi:hypothetical protein